jgi:glycerol-3-phosphate dehydrogenase
MHAAGGKWTTYRRMAEDALNTAVELKGIPTTRQCVTSTLKLLGGQQYKPALHTEVRWGCWGCWRRASRYHLLCRQRMLSLSLLSWFLFHESSSHIVR